MAGSVAVQPAQAPPVGAFAQDPNNCEDRTIDWYFSSAWDPYPTARGWAREAIGLWNQPLDFNGSQLAVVDEESDSGGGSHTLVNLQYHEELNGSSGCPPLAGAYIWINSDHIAERNFVRRVSKHEIGHLLGFEHSGAEDSYNGDNPPIMATCLPRTDFQSTNILTQDDYAGLNWLWSSTSNRQLVANWGYEQGTSFWGFRVNPGGSSELEYVSSGGATGPGYVRHKNVDGSVMYQTVNVANGDDDEQYRVVANYKIEDGSKSAGISIAIYRQNLNHSDDDNGCSYADGLVNLNDPTPSYTPWWQSTTGWIVTATRQDNSVNETSWTWFGSGWVNPAAAEGYRFQVLAGAHEASPVWVDFDNVRIEGT